MTHSSRPTNTLPTNRGSQRKITREISTLYLHYRRATRTAYGFRLKGGIWPNISREERTIYNRSVHAGYRSNYTAIVYYIVLLVTLRPQVHHATTTTTTTTINDTPRANPMLTQSSWDAPKPPSRLNGKRNKHIYYGHTRTHVWYM